MAVAFVLTEHAAALTEDRVRRHEAARARLERAAGTAVESVHYPDVRDLGRFEAVVLSGSSAPWADHDPRQLERLGDAVRAFAGPVLGICAGMQLQATFAGGSVRTTRPPADETYRVVEVVEPGGLLAGLSPRASFWARHTDEVVELPSGFRVLARSAECGIEAIADTERRWWGTQFHPEEFSEEHPAGERVLRNFFAVGRSSS